MFIQGFAAWKIKMGQATAVSLFAEEVIHGLNRHPQKELPSKYFYDELGSALFEAITLLPEYGLTRADERRLRKYAGDVSRTFSGKALVAELGSGTGRKTRWILVHFREKQGSIRYRPIDVSAYALATCEQELNAVAEIDPIHAGYLNGLRIANADRSEDEQLLLLFLGSTIGNFDRNCIPDFLRQVRSHLRDGDLFLIGADLVKDIDAMIAAYDDPTGVTAAFNLNLLGRINRELDADFDLRSFSHEARWNERERRIEMHLRSERDQRVLIAKSASIHFVAGETIWTESSHKFTVPELDEIALQSGFVREKVWVDSAWPFAESLWRAVPSSIENSRRQVR